MTPTYSRLRHRPRLAVTANSDGGPGSGPGPGPGPCCRAYGPSIFELNSQFPPLTKGLTLQQTQYEPNIVDTTPCNMKLKLEIKVQNE